MLPVSDLTAASVAIPGKKSRMKIIKAIAALLDITPEFFIDYPRGSPYSPW